MQRTFGTLLVAGSLVLAACSSGDDVSDESAAPTKSAPSETTTDETSALESDDSSTVTSPTTPSTGDASDETVALPGLIDPSDETITNDDAVRTGTLDNGLQYYVRHNESPGGKASLRLSIKAGSVDETGPHTGVAHFVEHMMFNGTEEFPENEL